MPQFREAAETANVLVSHQKYRITSFQRKQQRCWRDTGSPHFREGADILQRRWISLLQGGSGSTVETPDLHVPKEKQRCRGVAGLLEEEGEGMTLDPRSCPLPICCQHLCLVAAESRWKKPSGTVPVTASHDAICLPPLSTASTSAFPRAASCHDRRGSQWPPSSRRWEHPMSGSSFPLCSLTLSFRWPYL